MVSELLSLPLHPHLFSQPRHIRMGGKYLAGRLAVGEVSPLVIVFMRWTIVFAILLMTKRKELPAALPKLKGKWPWVFMMGALDLFFSCFYVAAQSTTAIIWALFNVYQCSS